jgi:hypothetical protein
VRDVTQEISMNEMSADAMNRMGFLKPKKIPVGRQ